MQVLTLKIAFLVFDYGPCLSLSIMRIGLSCKLAHLGCKYLPQNSVRTQAGHKAVGHTSTCLYPLEENPGEGGELFHSKRSSLPWEERVMTKGWTKDGLTNRLPEGRKDGSRKLMALEASVIWKLFDNIFKHGSVAVKRL